MYIIEFGGYCQKNWYAKPRTSEAKGRNVDFWKGMVDLIEILEIMVQTGQSVIFLTLKPTKVTSDFILN